MYQVLFEMVTPFMEMTELDKELCFKYFEPVKFSKNTIVENRNQIPQYQYFVVSGIMRNYFYNILGETITTDLN